MSSIFSKIMEYFKNKVEYRIDLSRILIYIYK